MAITDKKISETYANRDVASLGDRPNEDGLTAAQLKARFDQLPKEVIPQYNALIDELNDTVLPGKSDVGHTHDDRYFTETEVGVLLSGKSDTSHTHDGRYYTETETDALLSGKSDTTHNHDLTYSPVVHTHDDRYYTETETNTLLATKADKLYATNFVTNGDFSNGTTGWSSNSSNNSVTSNTLTNTANGTNSYAYPFQNYSFVSGRVYYLRAKARVANSSATVMYLRAGTTTIYTQNTPALNTWYNLSGIFTATTQTLINILHAYADAATANGKVMEVQYVLAIDLTAIFGAGKEPSATQMDNLLSTFTNSWFNGTSELVNIANLAQLKADKTQEAWITPTLINSWATFVGNTPQYYKDNFGRVHIKGSVQSGTVSTVAFVLPVGYRPAQAFQYVGLSSGGTFGRVSIDSAGNLTIGQFGTYLNFDGVSFRSA